MSMQHFTQPVLGVFTQFTNTQLPPHTFAVIFDRSDDGRITDYRVLDYNGTYKPPAAPEYTDKELAVDHGILMPITPEAAERMTSDITRIRNDLMAKPKIQSYHYAASLLAPSQRQLTKGRRPTNCTHYIVQSAIRAGVDMQQLDYSCNTMDRVHEMADMIEERMQTEHVEALLMRGMPHQPPPAKVFHCLKPLADNSAAIYFHATKDVSLTQLLESLPEHYLPTLSEQSAPMVQSPETGQTNWVTRTAITGVKEIGG